MNRSALSNIIATTRLLPHFSSENLALLKSCIFDEVKCDNEKDFLCKALLSLVVSRAITLESTTIIKNKVMQIADSQQMNINVSLAKNATPTNNIHVSVNKYIQQQYNDPFSQLHGDIIDYLGAFLSKKQSIEFEYLNKQLYIETQKQSYLLKRCKDPPLILNDWNIFKLIMTRVVPFNHYFPTHLKLNFWNYSKWYPFIKQIPGYNNFFRRLNTFYCTGFSSLSLVPCEILFDTSHNLYQNAKRRYQIKKFKIDVIINEKWNQGVETFCQQFNEYKNSIGDESKIRGIEEFELSWSNVYDRDRATAKYFTMQLLLTCSFISKSIRMLNVSLVINTIQELQTIFHDNMKSLDLKEKSSVAINGNVGKIDNNKNSGKNINHFQIGHMESLVIHASHDFQVNPHMVHPIFNTLNTFDRFNMRRLIKRYTIEWTPFVEYFRGNIGFVIVLIYLIKYYFKIMINTHYYQK